MKLGEFELNKVYCMDCLDGLKKIPDKSVDLVVTDPPYNINLIPQRGLTKSIINDNLSKYEFLAFIDKYFSECKRVLKDNTFLITFCGWSTIPEFREVLQQYFTIKSQPIWVKNNFGIGYFTRPQYEPLILCLNGDPSPPEKAPSDVWFFDKILAPEHSCEKPVKLLRFIIDTFSNKDQIVLDGFVGGGELYGCI